MLQKKSKSGRKRGPDRLIKTAKDELRRIKKQKIEQNPSFSPNTRKKKQKKRDEK